MKIIRALQTEQISKLKQRESKNDVVPLIGNLPTMRLILAWPKVEVFIHEEVETEREELWAGIDLDFQAIAEMARIPFSHIEQHVREAQAHHWIYPDGTVHAHALELARSTIVKVARGKVE